MRFTHSNALIQTRKYPHARVPSTSLDVMMEWFVRRIRFANPQQRRMRVHSGMYARPLLSTSNRHVLSMWLIERAHLHPGSDTHPPLPDTTAQAQVPEERVRLNRNPARLSGSWALPW